MKEIGGKNSIRRTSRQIENARHWLTGDIDDTPATERVATWQPIDITPLYPEIGAPIAS